LQRQGHLHVDYRESVVDSLADAPIRLIGTWADAIRMPRDPE